MFNKRLMAARRRKLFWLIALVCSGVVLAYVDVPLLRNAMADVLTLQGLALPALANLLTFSGLLVAASGYGRANVEIERLRLDA